MLYPDEKVVQTGFYVRGFIQASKRVKWISFVLFIVPLGGVFYDTSTLSVKQMVNELCIRAIFCKVLNKFA